MSGRINDIENRGGEAGGCERVKDEARKRPLGVGAESRPQLGVPYRLTIYHEARLAPTANTPGPLLNRGGEWWFSSPPCQGGAGVVVV